MSRENKKTKLTYRFGMPEQTIISDLSIMKMNSIRAFSVSFYVRIFEHNFAEDKAKIRSQADCQGERGINANTFNYYNGSNHYNYYTSTTTTTQTTNPKPIENFDLTMRNGERYTIETEQSNLIFKSNNTDVAVVSKSGVITAIGESKATITVIFSNGNTSQFFLNVISAEHISCDVNSDGKFDVTDVILLKKWLLAVPDVKHVDWKAADLCENGRFDLFDLCMMKRILVGNS